MPQSQSESAEHLVQWANNKLIQLERWWQWSWWRHTWMVGLSYVLAIAVPFGLAALLYVGDDSRDAVVIVTLVFSGVSLILQVLDNVLRQKDRAVVLRSVYEDLAHDLAQFRAGLMAVDVFLEATLRAKDRLKIDMGDV